MQKQGVSWDAGGLWSPPAFSLCAEYWLVPAPYTTTASTSIWGRCWLSLEASTCRNALIISERGKSIWLCCLQTCNKPGVVGGGKLCVYNRLCTVCLRVNGWCDIVLLISHVCDGWQDYSVSLILVSCSLSDTSYHQHHILFSHIALGPLSSYKLKLCTL